MATFGHRRPLPSTSTAPRSTSQTSSPPNLLSGGRAPKPKHHRHYSLGYPLAPTARLIDHVHTGRLGWASSDDSVRILIVTIHLLHPCRLWPSRRTMEMLRD